VFEAASGFLATRAIAGGSQNRPTDCLQFHLAASAYLGEVLLLFLVHCDRPFVDPVYEVILALVRNVRNGSISTKMDCPRDVRFPPVTDQTADIAAGPVRANKRHQLEMKEAAN
jgi:hypothetical protein